MSRYSIELIVETDRLGDAAALAESAADFLGALADKVKVGTVALWEPNEQAREAQRDVEEWMG